MNSERHFGGGVSTTDGEDTELPKETRQRRKLMRFYLSGGDEREIFEQGDARVSRAQEQEVKERLGRGEVSREQEHRLLSQIETPVHAKGAEVVYKSIANADNPFEVAILDAFGGRDDELDPGKVKVNTFIARYETPMDFERAENGLRRRIEGSRKTEIEKTMLFGAIDGVKRKIYGKQEVYYQEMKQLHREAEEMIRDEERRLARPVRTEMDRRTERVELDSSTKQELGQKGLGLFNRLMGGENERNREVVVDSGQWMISRRELKGESNNSLESEDRGYMDAKNGMFGVFDGAGGVRGGAQASSTAVDTVRKMVNKYGPVRNEADIRSLMTRAHEAVERNPQAGITTGVIGRVVEDERGKRLIYGCVGDSRIYLFRGKNVMQVTKDEGYQNVITNALGDGECEVRQTGTVPLRKGDRLLFCSDGITGDKEEQALDPREMVKTMMKSRTAFEAAQKFTRIAKKIDDRTAVVAFT